MIASKFGLGQQVRHQLLGFLGVVVDVDPEYSLDDVDDEEMTGSESLRHAPWYHVVMEDDDGDQVHTYIAEAQLSWALPGDHPEQPSMDDLAASIRQQYQAPRLKH